MRRARAKAVSRAIGVVALLVAPVAVAGVQGSRARAQVGTTTHVIQISVDGLSSSALQSLMLTDPTSMTSFARLIDEGASTFNARADYFNSATLPNHVTMMTGRPVLRPSGLADTVHHGWEYNLDPTPSQTLHNSGNPFAPYKSSVYDVAHDNGMSTAMYASKTKFSLFDVSYNEVNGAADVTGVDNGRDKIDRFVANSSSTAMHSSFLSAIALDEFNYSLVHYAGPDAAGHGSGWGSADYNNALRTMDVRIGQILDTIRSDPGLNGSTAVIVTSDHGGLTGVADHGNAEAADVYTIPLFVWGPGVASGADLYALNPSRADPGTGRPTYTDPAQPIRNGETATLALNLLGLPPIPGSLMRSPIAVSATVPPPTTTTVPPATTSTTTTVPSNTGSVVVGVAANDDVEEVVGNGRMYLDSSDLELIDDDTYVGVQRVGLRFNTVTIPKGATVTSANIDFVVDERDSVATTLTLRATATDNAAAFASTAYNLSARPLTNAATTWSDIAPWTVVGATQRTPDLSPVIQEVVNRAGWASGNSIAVVITGTGHRTAVAADSGPNTTPRLTITYTTNGG